MENQIYTIWLPLLITVVFAVIGMVRGVVREAIVAASVVLAAFINLQWTDKVWADSLNLVFPGMDKGQEQFILSLIVLWLIVPVVGYGLGTLLPKQQLATRSWIGGMLLGLLSGAAVAGLTLLYAYTGLDGAETTSRFYQNLLSRGFMVWAGWFPLLLAFLAALVVLLVPIRRAQIAVARPSPASNWGPSGRPGIPGALPPQTPAPAMASSMFPTPASAPAGTGVGAGTAMGASEVTNAMSYPQAPQPTILMPEWDATPTTLIPVSPLEAAYRESQHSTPITEPATEPQLSVTRSFDAFHVAPPAPTSADEGSQNNTDTFSAFSAPDNTDSSWLLQSLQSIEDNQKQTERHEPGGLAATTSFGTEHSISSPAIPASVDQPAEAAPATPVTEEKRCPNCGSPVMPGALFCTECGTRLIFM